MSRTREARTRRASWSLAAGSVVASALSPALLGVMLDFGVSIEALALGCAAYVVLGVAILARLFAPGRTAGAETTP